MANDEALHEVLQLITDANALLLQLAMQASMLIRLSPIGRKV